MSNPWTWDPNRQAYYVWQEAENAFVYADGTRVYAGQAAAASNLPLPWVSHHISAPMNC
jgi:hypothetical protein